MTDTLSYLLNKAHQLHIRLRMRGIHSPKSHKHHTLAYALGFECWDDLKYCYELNPVPHTSYCLDPSRLSIDKSIPIDKSVEIINEIRWPNEYIPSFNLLPITAGGYVPIPAVFMCSHLFSSTRNRKKDLLRQRISFFDKKLNQYKDCILFSGEQLNFYDLLIFLALIQNHPIERPVGRYFDISMNQISIIIDRKLSIKSVDNSFKRMHDCRVEILPINFFGPLISEFKKIKTSNGFLYRVNLNPELVKLYRDPMYGFFMDSGNLFHYNPAKQASQIATEYKVHMNSLKKLKKFRPQELWPTYESDMAAIWSIITKDASNGSVEFKILQEVKYEDNNETVCIKFPEWFIVCHRHFLDLYGTEYGSAIFDRSVRLFLEPFFVRD